MIVKLKKKEKNEKICAHPVIDPGPPVPKSDALTIRPGCAPPKLTVYIGHTYSYNHTQYKLGNFVLLFDFTRSISISYQDDHI